MAKLFICLFIFNTLLAHANLQVYPTRVYFSGKKRADKVSIRNKGKETTKYRVELIYYKMKHDGSYEIIDNPNRKETAMDLIRYSPRLVSLAPEQQQIIRISLRKPGDLAARDYVTHMRFLPLGEEQEKRESLKASKEQPEMVLKPQLAIAIPIVVHHGEVQSTAEFANLKYIPAKDANEKSQFSVDLNKKGDAFLYGDFKIYFQSKDAGENRKEVGIVKGVSSYVEHRTIQYPLNLLQDGEQLKNGELIVEFLEAEEDLINKAANQKLFGNVKINLP